MARQKLLSIDPFTVPSLGTANPKYGELSVKYSQLSRRHANLTNEIRTLAIELHGSKVSPANSSVGDIEKHEALVAELGELATDLIETGVITPPARPQLTPNDKLRALQRDKEVVEIAMNLLRPKLEAERLAASRIIVGDARHYYKTCIDEMAAALTAVGLATIRLNKFYAACQAESVSLSTLNRVAHPGLFGRGGVATSFLQQAIKSGLIRKEDVPAELLDTNI